MADLIGFLDGTTQSDVAVTSLDKGDVVLIGNEMHVFAGRYKAGPATYYTVTFADGLQIQLLGTATVAVVGNYP